MSEEPGERDHRIRLGPGVEDAGLAAMLADLVRQNLQQDPRKEADFARLRGDISMSVPDADVSVTLEFSRGTLVVHAGLHDSPGIRVSADASTLLALPLVKISAGLPNFFSRESRALRDGLLGGGVKIGGMLRHPVMLVRFTRLISVHG